MNNTGGLNGGSTEGPGFWSYVLALGLLLTQYTITGYDASAHLAEETHGAANSAARGIWQSIFSSAIGGWILLSFLFAVPDKDAVTAGGGGVQGIFDQALSPRMAATVLMIAAIGQLFCTTACLTSCSRMRPGARAPRLPRWGVRTRLTQLGVSGFPRQQHRRGNPHSRDCRTPIHRSPLTHCPTRNLREEFGP